MMGLAPMRDVAHALEDACGFLGRAAARRGDEAAALLVSGGGLLVDLIGDASPETDGAAAKAFVEEVRRFLAAAPESSSAERDRRQTDRRGQPRIGEGDGAGNVVRVDFRRLDAMLELLGEGLIQHSGLTELYRRLQRRVGACPEMEELDQTVLSLQKTLTRLESTLMETRLLPVSTVFGRFPAAGARRRPRRGEEGAPRGDGRRDHARQGGARPTGRAAAPPAEQRRRPRTGTARGPNAGGEAAGGRAAAAGRRGVGPGRHPGQR